MKGRLSYSQGLAPCDCQKNTWRTAAPARILRIMTTIPTPWLDHYDAGMPRSIGSYPAKTLVDVFAETARRTPDAIFLSFKGAHFTYAEVDRAVDALAHSLQRLGVGAGDRVALLLPNSPQFIISEMAVWKLRAICAPQSALYTGRELADSLNVSGAETAIVLTPFYERVKSIQQSTRIKNVIATNIKEYLPPLLRVAFTLLKEKKEGHRVTLHDGDFWLQRLITDGALGGPFTSRARPEDHSLILMSGGTTGTPKGVASDHRSSLMTGTQLSAWMREPLSTPGVSIMVPLPLFHAYACCAIQSVAILSGARLILVPNARDIGDLVKTIKREKPAVFCGVPTLFNAILNHPDVVSGKVDFRSIKACFSGAAALLGETKKRFEEMTGGRIIEAYGLTESTVAACANPYSGPNKVGSVGMPCPDVTIRIVDSEDDSKPVDRGQVGEIVMSAPQLMLSYWNNAEETANIVRRGEDGQRWLFTGDLGYLDEDGYLFIVDRKKDLIKTSGFQVWPREVEEVLATHPAVAEVGVAGLPDERKGEIVAAWVVPRGTDINVQELRAFCTGKLAPYKVPSRIEIRKELPKTMVGKVLRRVLVAEALVSS